MSLPTLYIVILIHNQAHRAIAMYDDSNVPRKFSIHLILTYKSTSQIKNANIYIESMLPDVDAVRRAFPKKYQEKLAVEI